MIPLPTYNAKPAPIHSGDFDGAGFSTAFLTSSGFALLQGGAGSSGQESAAAKSAMPLASGGLASPIVALALVGGLFLYFDRRTRR